MKHILTVRKRKDAALRRIAAELRTSSCPLRATATQAVAGEGNPEAVIMFIGEAPGKKEDETGRQFVGAAGRVLTSLLERIHISRESVFITSIEKFRPPNNREPKPEEIMACFPYLERQINIIEPRIIVTLGRHALRRMLEWEKGAELRGGISMDLYHGRTIRGTSDRIYYPLHHPASALYHPAILPILLHDMIGLEKIFKKI